MKILVSSDIPQEAKKSLSDYGGIIEFSTKGITYDSIASHPDVFFCKTENQLIVAPNVPNKYFDIFKKENISFIIGENLVGEEFPKTVFYNAVATEHALIHNLKYTDLVISNLYNDKKKINVNQAYCRCNLIPLRNNSFVTSDKNIFNVLKNIDYNILFVDPKDIILPGQIYGFIGGCCGTNGNDFFVIGNLDFFKEGNVLRQFIISLNYNLVELYNGPLFDGGSILFL